MTSLFSTQPVPLALRPTHQKKTASADRPAGPHFGGRRPRGECKSACSKTSLTLQTYFTQANSDRDWDRDHQAFLRAMQYADLPTIRKLLRKQSSVVRQSSLFNSPEDTSALSALHFLAWGKLFRTTPTIETLRDIVRLCRSYGANFNAKDCQGKTPLMLASFVDDLPMVKLLLENGANINARDKNGYTAVDYARSNTPSQSVALLSWLQEFDNMSSDDRSSSP